MTQSSPFMNHVRTHLLNRIRRGVFFAIGCAALAAASIAHPQSFPAKPIRMIVPFPTGTSGDLFVRIVGRKLQDAFGQPVIVDNRPGANGIIGVEALAKSAPDGYTIGLGSNGTHCINVSLYRKLPYDPLKDFAPITHGYGVPFAIAAQSGSEGSVAESWD